MDLDHPEWPEAVVVYTNAPPEYDWGWTHHAYWVAGDCRCVVIKDRFHADMQTDRYNSGLYWATDDINQALSLVDYMDRAAKAKKNE